VHPRSNSALDLSAIVSGLRFTITPRSFNEPASGGGGNKRTQCKKQEIRHTKTGNVCYMHSYVTLYNPVFTTSFEGHS